MDKITHTLPESIRAVALGACVDDCHPVLANICLTGESATAGNGYVLVRMTFDKEHQCPGQTEQVLLNAAALRCFVKHDFTLEAEEEVATLRQTVPGGIQSMEMPVGEGKFFDADGIIARSGGQRAFYINPKFLELTAKVAQIAGHTRLRVQPGVNANDPVRIDGYSWDAGDKLTIVVMPMTPMDGEEKEQYKTEDYGAFVRSRLNAGDDPNEIERLFHEALQKTATDWVLGGDGKWHLDTVCAECGAEG